MQEGGQIATGFIPVQDQVLASVLLALDVPLQQKLADREWAPITNLYSAKNPLRKNGRPQRGQVTFFFAPHTRNGKIPTKQLILAWEQVGEQKEGDPNTQSFTELNKVWDAFEDGSVANMSDHERKELADRGSYWMALAHVQAVRVSLSHHQNLNSQIDDPTRIIPRARFDRPGKGWKFRPLSPSQL